MKKVTLDIYFKENIKKLRWESFLLASGCSKENIIYENLFKTKGWDDEQGDPLEESTAKHFAYDMSLYLKGIHEQKESEIELYEYFYNKYIHYFKEPNYHYYYKDDFPNEYIIKDSEIKRILYIFENTLTNIFPYMEYIEVANKVFGDDFYNEYTNFFITRKLYKEDKYKNLIKSLFSFKEEVEVLIKDLMNYKKEEINYEHLNIIEQFEYKKSPPYTY